VRSDGGGVAISRENVAHCIVAALQTPAALGQTVGLLDGETPVEELFG
jgi:hypothetical protein